MPAGRGAEAGRSSSSHDVAPPPSAENSYPPTDQGVMRGWLTTHTPPAGQRLWFVLSAETLAYYESPEMCDAAEPLGMLGVDEMQSVKGARANNLPARAATQFYPHAMAPPRWAHLRLCDVCRSQRASGRQRSSI